MLCFSFHNFVIEVLNTTGSLFKSAHAQRTSVREYRLDDDEAYVPSSCHEVRVLSGTSEHVACLLAATGGGTGIHQHSAFIHDDALILAVGPFVISLHLPSLELNWKCQSDDATCFGMYHVEAFHCYVSHGELEVARISYSGAIDWSQGGADIFTGAFVLLNNRVEVTDWNNKRYRWDIRTGNPLPVTLDANSKDR